ncbi:hypothetical protein BVY03_05825 [bacterium K02(2017)]|nr:hypothetical protein BVY03_05825 [bacterium K02(2017)]
MNAEKHNQQQSNQLFDNQPLTVDELCTYLQAAKSTVYDYNRQGMPRFRVGKSWRYDPSKVVAWLEERSLAEIHPNIVRFDPNRRNIK